MCVKLTIFYLLLSLLLAACESKTDEVIFTTKHIVTMDPEIPQAQAVYLLDGKISQLGSVAAPKAAHPNAIVDNTFANKR